MTMGKWDYTLIMLLIRTSMRELYYAGL